MAEPAFRRVLLKLSGEILAGEEGFGIDPERASYLANEVKSIRDLGVGVGLIIGAGNIFRGIQAASKGMDRVTGDYLGMLATIMNAISLQDALEKAGCETQNSVRHQCGSNRRTLYSEARHPSPGKRTNCHCSRWDRESFLYHRFRGSAAGYGTGSGNYVEGYKS
tara:strand:- start:421 stop:915 length:495 start_codon:yes stop_codon:yes gene_type:complete